MTKIVSYRPPRGPPEPALAYSMTRPTRSGTSPPISTTPVTLGTPAAALLDVQHTNNALQDQAGAAI
eukprot:SAG22_NODE_4_length_44774_cov_362.122149_5_plen_67_part_00